MVGLGGIGGLPLVWGATPHLVKDINPGPGSSDPHSMSVASGVLYFLADDGLHGEKFWQSDGTPVNTSETGNSHPGQDAHPGQPGSSAAGLVADLIKALLPRAGLDSQGNTPALGGGVPGNFAFVNGLLFFPSDDGAHGSELWMSDGSASGAVMVRDINPGSGGSSPANLVNVNGTLYFTADDGAHGRELWSSDGTVAGTIMVADIAPGAAGSSPDSLTVAGNTLFFTADDGTHGVELWAMSFTSTPAELSDFTVE